MAIDSLFTNLSIQSNTVLLFKIAFILFSIAYFIFSLVIVRQITLMTQVVRTEGGLILRLVGFLHAIASLGIIVLFIGFL